MEMVKKSGENLVPIKFKVHKDLIEKFQFLKMDYAKFHKNFALSNNQMFAIMVEFMFSDFQENNILLDCNVDFKTAVMKVGKRKATERTFTADQVDNILFTVPETIGDKFMDVMFSYISNDKDDSVFNDHHSRTYFFYDFIDFMNLRKNDLMKFQLS